MTIVRHLGIEATRLLREKRGIGRYVRNMLVQLPLVRPDLRFTLFVTRTADIDPARALLRTISPDAESRSTIRTVAELPDTDADVVWYPWNYLKPAAKHAAMVPTVHDVAPMLQLDHRWWKVIKRFKHRRRYQRTVDQATLVMTISGFTAQEVRRHLDVDPAKLRITLLAADDLRVAAGENSEVLERLGIDGPFFLTVGAHDARKNMGTLYRAMAQLNERGIRAPLVQCGPNVKRDHADRSMPWLLPAGYVSDAELATLYRRATALVFPSRYEGFGLPVSEAMMAGGCVICAGASSLPEVGGDAAIYFPWSDAGALTAQMQRLLDDPELRERHARMGPAQAAQFTWDRCARETVAVFEEAAAMRKLNPTQVNIPGT